MNLKKINEAALAKVETWQPKLTKAAVIRALAPAIRAMAEKGASRLEVYTVLSEAGMVMAEEEFMTAIANHSNSRGVRFFRNGGRPKGGAKADGASAAFSGGGAAPKSVVPSKPIIADARMPLTLEVAIRTFGGKPWRDEALKAAFEDGELTLEKARRIAIMQRPIQKTPAQMEAFRALQQRNALRREALLKAKAAKPEIDIKGGDAPAVAAGSKPRTEAQEAQFATVLGSQKAQREAKRLERAKANLAAAQAEIEALTSAKV